MKAQIEIDENYLVVFKTTSAYLTGKLFLSLLFVLWAVVWIVLVNSNIDSNWIVIPVSISVVLLAVMILIAKWRSYPSCEETEHVIFFSMDKNGISHAPHSGMVRDDYQWSEITKIVFSDSLISRKRETDSITGIEQYECRHVILIYLNVSRVLDSAELDKRNLSISPAGTYYVMTNYPEDQKIKYLAGVRRFAEQRVEVESFKEIFFDSCNTDERYVV